ncbi:xanthine dehydrogenase family protein molybdopterin-binding subunit [Falsiroseomonas selenitidurans]|uniref:Xanthine dehydrogenase family protein molybdopterin-binding subunit n=1 Tax=Falsiroseomonas selenitidurans TaxID=2716335 RepID=A0ABX1E5L5_9PROT|nr:xanthine dehydrogenase family protein molybdopterin-binding subunit [Falsiroseomonas selenitidurans]NKC32068.1 xanthine dehydrogenase family protein molybdopterin-binding subunit [Falsiroseomonas selenitidurans]
MAFDVLPGLGQPLRRLEDPRLLTGGGRYTADLVPPGVLHAAFLRSPHAHARILGVEAAAARALPGVVAVFTGADVAGLGHNPAVTEIRDAAGRRHVEPQRLPIPTDRVRHVGEIVAMVVAETPHAARDGAEALVVDYDPLPAVVQGDAALAPGAPQLHATAPGNLVCDWQKGDAATVEAAFAGAAHIARVAHRSPRILAGYLETRAALAEWAEGRVTLTTPSQGVHLLHRILCDHILGWKRERLRVVTPDVGGGFGPKLPPYPEQALACFAADRLRRSVLWVQDRTEHHLADTHARDLVAEAELALDAQGRFLAVRVRAVANFGAWVSTVNPTIPTGGMAKVLAGLYRIPAIHIAMRCAFSNTAPVDAVRGAGKPEALVLLERLVDVAARETGRDPAALRGLNLLRRQDYPHTTALGYRYDSGDPPALLEAVLELARADDFPARRAAAASRGRLLGRGLSCHLHGSGGWGDETSVVEVLADGTILARTGTQNQGQGHATAYAQLLAAAFGVAPGMVRIEQGDSDRIPRGGGTGGSSSTIISGTTLARAAEAAVEQGRGLAAAMLEAAAVDVVWEDGAYAVAGTDRRVALAAVAARAGGLEGRADFAGTVETWPAGIAWAEVELDPETGAVTLLRHACAVDAGAVVNPMLLAGQLQGGWAAGIGQALLESARYDAEGQMQAATLMDYAMPRAADLPGFVHVDRGVPSPNNALGIKGVGELPTNGAPAALANAVADALAQAGVMAEIPLPMTAERVWAALSGAGA